MIVVSNYSAMEHHAKLFAKSYGLQSVPMEEAYKYKDIYQLGIYNGQDYDNIVNRNEGRVVLHWCGIDAFLYARRKHRYRKEFPSFVEHLAQSVRQQEVLKKYNIDIKVSHRFNDRRENYSLTSLPEKFSVLIFTSKNSARDLLFCFQELYDIIQQCPDIHFTLFGRDTGFVASNVTTIGWISLLDQPETYRDILKQVSCVLRFTRNKTEGFSQLTMQMLLLGRRVISNIEQEYVEKFELENRTAIINRLYELKEIKETDKEASDFYHNRADINNFDFLRSKDG